MADQTSRIVAELERSECEELCLRKGSPLACGVMCFVSSRLFVFCFYFIEQGKYIKYGVEFNFNSVLSALYYFAHILRIVRKLRIFCTYLEDCAQTAHILHMYTSCAHFAHVPNILLTTYILHICRMWFTSAQNECSTRIVTS